MFYNVYYFWNNFKNNSRTPSGWFLTKHPVNKNLISLNPKIIVFIMRIFTVTFLENVNKPSSVTIDDNKIYTSKVLLMSISSYLFTSKTYLPLVRDFLDWSWWIQWFLFLSQTLHFYFRSLEILDFFWTWTNFRSLRRFEKFGLCGHIRHTPKTWYVATYINLMTSELSWHRKSHSREYSVVSAKIKWIRTR